MSVPTAVSSDVVPLDAERARRFYDRMGRWQDSQGFYEDAATRHLVHAAGFSEASSVFELGCGTGRLAAELLAGRLPNDARYLGVDVSPTMVRLARQRLAPWGSRAEVRLLEPPTLKLPGEDGSFDRLVATYVFDLLSADDAGALIDEARRLLARDGLLALVSLTHGTTALTRVVSGAWGTVALQWPGLVGGCRPIELNHLLAAGSWHLVEREVVTSWGISSEMLVASRQPSP